MKFTIPGKDVIKIDEKDFESKNIIQSDNKIHLIKLDFKIPTNEKIKWVLQSYNSTNRYIINNNIKIYNNYLRRTNKKYYIENTKNDKLVSFFKKNNKVLLNFLQLNVDTLNFIINDSFKDVLYNTEVIIIDKNIYDTKKEILNMWRGNIIINDDDYKL